MALLAEEPRRGDCDGHGAAWRRRRHEGCTGSVSVSVRGSVLPGARRMRRWRAMEDDDRSMLCNRTPAWNGGLLLHLQCEPGEAGPSAREFPQGLRHMLAETRLAQRQISLGKRKASHMGTGNDSWEHLSSLYYSLRPYQGRYAKAMLGGCDGQEGKGPPELSARGYQELLQAGRKYHQMSTATSILDPTGSPGVVL